MLFRDELVAPGTAEAMSSLRVVLVAMDDHRGGLSYGLLRKLLVLSGNLRGLDGVGAVEALDSSAVVALGPLLIAASAESGRSLGDRLKSADVIALPRLKQWCEEHLQSADEFGFVAAGL
jgi:hypothetical protein